MLKPLLEHRLTRGIDIDDPRTTHLRKRILEEKGFLKRIYQEWYTAIAASLPSGSEPVLELGSGAGFLSDYIPNLITSEVFSTPDIAMVLQGQTLPFAPASLRAIVMTDVFHHIPDAAGFLAEATRCVRPGGRLIMIEPWNTHWSRLIYTHLHHEPFVPDADAWSFPEHGPLSGANGALPWIVFVRDRAWFEQHFPQWQILSIEPMMPFRYLVSGGVSLRTLMPEWSFDFWQMLEHAMHPWMDSLGMFAHIVVQRTDK